VRILIGQIYYEGNDFNPVPTTLENFSCLRGSEILNQDPLYGEIGGFLSRIRQHQDESINLEIIPTVAASALSGGRVTRAAFDVLCEYITEPIDQAQEIDGVLLSLHGAMIVDGVDDSEGFLLERVRDLVGPSVPIVVTLDLHANVTHKMVSHSDLIVGYQTCPHEDAFETGYKAAQHLLSYLSSGLRPEICWKKLPMITPVDAHNTSEDCRYRDLYQLLADIERKDHVESASIFTVQPWLDVSELGYSVLVYTSAGHSEVGSHSCRVLHEFVWASKNDLLVERNSLNQGISIALATNDTPAILVHSSDSIPAGAPGDNTLVLKALLDAAPQAPVYIAIVDAEAVQRAQESGVGTQVCLEVGGKREHNFCSPLSVSGQVLSSTEAIACVEGPVFCGNIFHLGQTVVLRVGFVHIVVTSNSYPGHDPSVYRSVGLKPEDAQAVVVNSAIHYRANYRAISKNFVLFDSPGVTTSNLCSLPFQNIDRPMFPLDAFVD
jgi:microcystin degradation protein MlrC